MLASGRILRHFRLSPQLAIGRQAEGGRMRVRGTFPGRGRHRSGRAADRAQARLDTYLARTGRERYPPQLTVTGDDVDAEAIAYPVPKR